MTRTLLALTGAVLLALCLAPTANSVVLDGHDIIFTGCPPYVAGYHCDSMFYQVVAVDVATMQACHRVRYLLVSGPGTINPRTGLWVYHPELEDTNPHIRPYVEIAAYIGHDTTTSDDNCSFQVIVRDHGPRIRADGGLEISLLPGKTASRTFTMTDDDWCDSPRFVEMQVLPTPAGDLTYNTEMNVLSFTPAVADSGRIFDVTLTFESGPVRPVVSVRFNVGVRQPVDPQYAVRIETKDTVHLGTLADMAVTLESIDVAQGIGGFDFLLGYDASAISFQSAGEGELYSLCEWEYFTYRFGPDGVCDSGCPSGMLAITGMAETNNGPYHPICNDGHPGYVDPGSLPVTLCSLRFLISSDANLEGNFMPVSFFWMDCADNVVSNFDGSKLYLSQEVYAPGDTLITCEEPFPTYCGSHATLGNEDCYYEDNNNNKYALAGIKFYNGGVQIPIADSIDAKGDINCNYIPFELADMITFANLYVSGGGLFGTAPACATDMADVDRDGTPWTVADYQYLKLIVVGEPAHPQPTGDTTWLSLDAQGNLFLNNEVAVLGLVLEGEVEVSNLTASLKMSRGVATNDSITVTIILLENWDWSGDLDPGAIFTLPVGTTILHAEASTHDAAPAPVVFGTTPGLNQYAVEIQKDSLTIPGHMVDIGVVLHGVDASQGLGGFNLLIGYHEEAMAFQSVTEGELYDLCGWEYFSFVRSYAEGCHEHCPGGLLRMIGLADMAGGANPDTLCFKNGPGQANLPITIATMRFLASNDRTLENQYVPIRFYWTECGDNVLSNRDGSTVYLASHVYEFIMYHDPFHLGEIACTDEFPTYCGTVTTLEEAGCFEYSPLHPKPAVPGVLFQNGGADFVGSELLDPRGDINLNGVPYEIADVVLFVQYFQMGPSVFGTHVDGSVWVSDVNQNGIPLELSDLILLTRIAIGDLDPDDIQLGPVVSGVLHRNAVDNGISITCDAKTTAMHLIVDGEITPQLLDSEMALSFGSDGGYTRILIMTDSLHPMAETPFVALPGAGAITKLDACDAFGNTVALTVDGITDVPEGNDALPTEFALGTNYPNPFNPTTTISYSLAEAAMVEIVVYNVMGQTVRTLVSASQSAGQYEVEWDGRDAGGSSVASGIYFYRMTAGDFTQSKKMMMLK